MGFGALRVINDDVIAPQSGFGMHPHRNMEIITIVEKGAVSHKDSMGNTQTVPAGDIQVMSAGTGIVHSEYNHSSNEELKLFQIWIYPQVQNVVPRYAQKSLEIPEEDGLKLLVSSDGRENSLFIHQNAFLYRGFLSDGKTEMYALKNPVQNGIYIFVVEGKISVEGNVLESRDALGITETGTVHIFAQKNSQYLLFEVPMEEPSEV